MERTLSPRAARKFASSVSKRTHVCDGFLPVIFPDRIKGVDDPAVCERFARVEGI